MGLVLLVIVGFLLLFIVFCICFGIRILLRMIFWCVLVSIFVLGMSEILKRYLCWKRFIFILGIIGGRIWIGILF